VLDVLQKWRPQMVVPRTQLQPSKNAENQKYPTESRSVSSRESKE